MNKHPIRIPTMITQNELMFRLCIPLSSWQHHVGKHKVVPDNLIHSTTVSEIIDDVKYPRGNYVEWPAVGHLLMNAFRDDQKVHTEERLSQLGFTPALTMTNGACIRVSNADIKLWNDALKEESLGKSMIPTAIDMDDFGSHSYSSTGIIVHSPTQLLDEQITSNGGRISTPTGQIRTEPRWVSDEDRANARKAVTDANSLIDEEIEAGSVIDINSIDFSNPEEVNIAQKKAKILTELNKSKKAEIDLAKISNSVIDVDDLERLLEGVMKAFRTTMDQAVPKVTKEIEGLIITQLVMDDPSLMQKLSNKVQSDVLIEQVRNVFNKSLVEFAELMESFAKVLDDDK